MNPSEHIKYAFSVWHNMGDNIQVGSSPTFHRRIATFSHAAIILAVFCLAMIHLESVLKPFFIALGIYFVLKPGADWLSKNSFPVFLSAQTCKYPYNQIALPIRLKCFPSGSANNPLRNGAHQSLELSSLIST